MFAIEVIDISKTYRLYNKPSDRLKEVIFRKQLHTSFASLSNISFSVPFGESLGIIGDNGAGKSTILKIVAGTISPILSTDQLKHTLPVWLFDLHFQLPQVLILIF